MSEYVPLVLVVDDDWMNLEVLQAYLEQSGFRVVTTQNGSDALALATAQLPDVVLLDMRLDGMDGLEICRRLKAAPETRRVPVLMVTAFHGDEEKRQAIDAGVDDFVLKPYDSLVMLRRVHSYARYKRLADQCHALRDALAQRVDAAALAALLAQLGWQD